MNEAFQHQDLFSSLVHKGSFNEKLRFLHSMLQNKFPFVHRLAVAKYEYENDMLDTYAFSCAEGSPLTQYSATLARVPSLQEVMNKRRPRLIDDMTVFDQSEHIHSRVLLKAGYLSSYTQPIICDEKFYGFLFFNARQKHVFTEPVLEELDLISHLIMLMVVNEWTGIEILKATLRSAQHMSSHRDPETGGHLCRMSHYARLIARNLASKYNINDEYIEHVFLFSPLHDLGKIAIGDDILQKPGKLTDAEFEIMKTHASKGADMVDELLNDYNLSDINYSQMLRSITELHHEAVDGSGYPYGLKREEIPFEARIVAVADVFDALTSKRPYKDAMDNKQAFGIIQEMSGGKLDEDCVAALLGSVEEILDIQKRFADDRSVSVA